MEVEVFARVATLLTALEHERSTDAPHILRDLYSTLDLIIEKGQFGFLVCSSWGPFLPEVCNYMMIRAEKNKDAIDQKAYQLAYAFFFKRSDFKRAAGAMMRLAELCLEQAMYLARTSPEDGEQIISLLQSAQGALSIAACVVDFALTAEALQGVPRSKVVAAEWGVSSNDQVRLARSVFNAEGAEGANYIIEHFHLLQETVLSWSAASVFQELAKTTAMVLLCNSRRWGYVSADTISALSAMQIEHRCFLDPSHVVFLRVPDIIDALARRGDIEAALSLTKAYFFCPSLVLQALVNHLVLCLDRALSMRDEDPPMIINQLFQLHHTLTYTSIPRHISVADLLAEQLRQRQLANGDLIELRNRYLVEVELIVAMIFDILCEFADDNCQVLPEYCNGFDTAFGGSSLAMELVLSVIAASKRRSLRDQLVPSLGCRDLLHLVNILFQGLFVSVIKANEGLVRIYADYFDATQELVPLLENEPRRR
ncbi:hypothetical protein GMRT_15775 [Giardia muris]|uniref:NUP160 middle TPR domain-containing protein n=1 Tax=Giardia muris TaxID=5742 RepID=A0A4Z1T9C1_GIAMU|nr:hypothetical protein GMRT_15775 [Giardia muris]|eukprot:TNJ29129.1 hypothetical protein GMRT_15775 [Giardia muris]